MHRDRASRGGEEWWKWRHGGDRGTLAEVWLLVVNKNYAPDYSAFRFFSALIATHVSIAVGRCVRILVYLHPSISRAPSTLPEMKRGYSTHLPSLHGDTSPFQPPIHSYDATDIASVGKSLSPLILSHGLPLRMDGGPRNGRVARPSSRIFPDHLFLPPSRTVQSFEN